METSKTYKDIVSENEVLRYQLEEATETIDAIRTGQIDALVVNDGNSHQLYTLKTADQTYRVFIEKMNEGAVTLNREGIILYSNSRFANMMKVPLQKMIGLSFDKFVPHSNAELFTKVIDSGWEKDCKEEIPLVNSEGEMIPFLLSCNVLELDEGPALSLILTDLTIQKNAEHQLKIKNEELAIAQGKTEKLNNELEDTVKERTNDLLISREHFKLLANNISQMTWTNLPDGSVNFYNQRWYEYTGLTYQQTKDWGWGAVVHPDDINETINRYMASLSSGNTFEIENRYKCANGTYRWHLNRANPLRNDDGDIVFWIGTATDIEDQKQQLERKDEFIGIASHELKTPLTSLKGYLQLITTYNKEELPAVVKQYIAKANIALNKLQRLVNDLLDVSKIQAGKLEYAVGNLDVNEVIKHCIENAAHIYPAYNFEDLTNRPYIIEGNAERLEQVLMNLLNNAVKYSPNGKNVAIKTSRHGNAVRISVIDQGIGLSDEQRGKIFERFYRVEDKKFSASGLGMGLYISNEIIKNHHGIIGVDSEPGIGSTFYFELPLV